MTKKIRTLIGIFSTGLLFFIACEKDTAFTPTDIKIGKEATSLNEVTIHPQSNRNIILSGGNGKYKVNIKDSKVAAASIHLDTLKLKGIWKGETFATIFSHNKKTRLNIKVKPSVISFTQSELLLYPTELNETISLGGGDIVTLEENDPEDILEVKWQGNGTVQILAKHEGDAKIIAKAKGMETKELKVKIRAIDEKGFLQHIGYYSTTSKGITQNITPLLIVKRRQLGTYLSGTNHLNNKNNWYQQISPIVAPKKGAKITIKMTGNITANQEVIVEEIREGKQEVMLRGRDFRLVLPYYKQ